MTSGLLKAGFVGEGSVLVLRYAIFCLAREIILFFQVVNFTASILYFSERLVMHTVRADVIAEMHLVKFIVCDSL